MLTRPDDEGGPAIDEVATARAVHDLLLALGQDITGESLQDTPRRVASTCAELLRPRSFGLTTFPNDEAYDEMVVARGIRFSPAGCRSRSG
jgi:GTP cyclohydrolase IA